MATRRNAHSTETQERLLGRFLFDRYPHLVPSPELMNRLPTLIRELEDPERALRWWAQAQPVRVLEAWFDCWARIAFRDPVGDGCSHDEWKSVCTC